MALLASNLKALLALPPSQDSLRSQAEYLIEAGVRA